uniref:Uncharacterized protein n=1 Tax=Avena sativa TaxID=4498 RepID=A0ACD5YY91_AVESA
MENEEHNVPLLAPRQAASASASAGAENGEYTVIRGGHAGGEAGLGQRLLEENRKLWKVAGPAICTRFSGFGVTVISQAFIGHIGPTELAAYALVSTVLMRFGNGILVSKLPRLVYLDS